MARKRYPSDDNPKPNKDRDSPVVPVTMPRELLDRLNDEIGDGNRSAWIVDAIEQKLQKRQ